MEKPNYLKTDKYGTKNNHYSIYLFNSGLKAHITAKKQTKTQI